MQAHTTVHHLLVGVTVLSLSVTPVVGQTVSEDASVASESGKEPPGQTTICMTRDKTLPANARSDASRKPTNIAVPEMQMASLTRKGFKVIDCGQAKLNTRAAQKAWRDKICAKAAFGNRAIQNQYARIYGSQPAILCAAAQRVAGKSDRKRPKEKSARANADK